MKTFNVLDPQEDLSDSRLLEASAGTGKTFAIEHCFVRLLFEGDIPCRFDEILTVTFTRAATSDLKKRIREQLKNASMHVSRYFAIKVFSDEAPAYLRSYDDEVLKKGLARVDDALCDFDAAAVYTIHQFCSRSLNELSHEAVSCLKAVPDDENSSAKVLKRKVHDFFLRSEVTASLSHFQWQQALKGSRKSFEELMSSVSSWAQKDLRLKELPPLSQSMEALQSDLSAFKERTGNNIEAVRARYEESKLRFNKFNAIDPGIFEDFLRVYSAKSFAEGDFDKVLRFATEIATLFKEGNKNLKKKSSFDFSFASEIYGSFAKYGTSIGSPLAIKVHLAEKLRQKISEDKLKEGLFSYQDFLSLMHRSLENEAFCAGLRQKYKVAIVDEFQDTDPLQWEIFQKLFCGGTHRLFLVGDPKQAIYRFRQADIYTYLSAANHLGQERHATLDTNYRSNSDLIGALNLLMDENNAPGWISLPKLDVKLPYRPVKAGRDMQRSLSRQALCFYGGEDELQELFLPVEILRLKREEGILFSDVAVLVADRNQEKKIVASFDAFNIPYNKIDKTDIRKSPVWTSLLDAMQAALHSNDPKFVKKALSGLLFGWSVEKVQELIARGAESLEWQEAAGTFFRLKKCWEESGFAAFLEQLMQTGERLNMLLKRPFGRIRALELQAIAEKLMAFEFESGAACLELIDWMKKAGSVKDDKSFLADVGSEEEAVQILTIHKSKGLEFEFVFAPGLSSEIKCGEDLICLEDDIGPCLVPAPEDDKGELLLADQQEVFSESLRRFYVAMTRAKNRVYVPLAKLDGKKTTVLKHFFSHLNIQDASSEGIKSHIKELGKKASIGLIELEAPVLADPWDFTGQKNELTLRTAPYICQKIRRLHSFSSLKTDKGGSAPLLSPPNDPKADIKNIHTLPAGSKTGILLHKVFENIDFTAEDHKVRLSIARTIAHTSLCDWQEVIFNSVKNVLQLPLINDFGTIYLRGLQAENCFREMEFQFAEKDFDEAIKEDELCHLKGVTDLVFLANGRYYILDWKSNWLGKTAADYSEERLKGAMDENGYTLQAKIYRKALEKYLKVVFPAEKFEDLFGGVFYLFIRGAEVFDGRPNGVLWLR